MRLWPETCAGGAHRHCSDCSHETSCLRAPRPAHRLTTAGCRGEQSGRFRLSSAAAVPPICPLCTPAGRRPRDIWVSGGCKRGDARASGSTVRAAGTKERRRKPLRQVRRKVLRNWQVDCARHAWAVPLGERRAQDTSIRTFWSTLALPFTLSN